MLRLWRVAVALTVAMGSGQPPASAQLVREHDAQGLRPFHGTPSRIRRSFQSDAEANAIFKHILAVSGLAGMEDRITIRATAGTDAAEAFVEKDERLIFYNAEFMQGIARKDKNYWSMVAILAHEVGHHIRFHTVIQGHDHKFELEADYQAGFILRRMGATLEQTQAAFRTLGTDVATATHPARAERVQMATLGWTDGGSAQTLTLPGSAQAKPSPQTTSAAKKKLDDEARAKADAERQHLAMLQREEARRKQLEAAGLASKQNVPVTQPGQVFRDCPDCPEMVVVPAGSFMMGSNPAEIAALVKQHSSDRYREEGPQHKVAIARSFAVGKYEVTFAEWDACVAAGGCTHNPGDEGWDRGRRPVINVSWDDAKEYVAWVSRTTGKTYRLLTEAEWEYAARGVTTASASSKRYWWGDSASHEYANFGKHQCCAGHKEGRDQWEHTAPVGQFPANPFGLHDMHGNVFEWVEDCWHGSYAGAPTDGTAWTTSCFETYRMLRGGSWYDVPQFPRAAVRTSDPSVHRSNVIGFRLARTLD